MRRLSFSFLILSILLLAIAPMVSAQAPNGQVKRMATILRLRQAPSPAGALIVELGAGTPLVVLGHTIDNNWFNVQTLEGQAGWVASGYVELLVPLSDIPLVTSDGGIVTSAATTTTTDTDNAAETVQTSQSAAGDVFVKHGITLRLRQDPNTSATVLAELVSGTPLEIVGQTEDGEWLNVNVSGQAGWVASQYVESANAATTSSGSSVSVHGVSGIYQRGVDMGNQFGVFAKVGDSISVSEHSYDALGRGQYNLGGYAGLQHVINTFANPSFNSFTNVSAAAGSGWTTAIVLDPNFRNTSLCQTPTSPLECELDRIRPSIALIQLGTNDVQYLSPDQFAYNLSRIVEICIDRGVVPVLTTIPHRVGFEANVDSFNTIIRNVATSQSLPLWDLKAALDNLPNHGLGGDGIHPSFAPGGYADSANFANPEALQTGYVTRNLTALQVLERVMAAMGE